MVKTIAFYAPKGGVGKSSRCLETAEALYSLGHRVAILELDAQMDITKKVFRRDYVTAAYSIEKRVDPTAEAENGGGDDGLSLWVSDFEEYYSRANYNEPNNIWQAIKPAIRRDGSSNSIFTPVLVELAPQVLVDHKGPPNGHKAAIWILPGHRMAQELDSHIVCAYGAMGKDGDSLSVLDKLVTKIEDK